jgi:hypothetical protein
MGTNGEAIPLPPPHVVRIHEFGRKGTGKHKYEMSDGSIVVMNELEALASAANHANSMRAKDARIAELERDLEQARAAFIGSENARKDAERAWGTVRSIDSREFRALADKWQLCLTTDIERVYAELVAYIDGRTAGTAPLDPVEGDLLPPVGSRVLIHLGRQDAWVEHTVIGYYVWGALSHQVREGEKHAHRVFVHVKDDQGYDNARLLSEVRIAAAPTPIKSGREEA